MSFNDAVMNEMRPHFRDEESLLVWLEVSMDHLMREYIARFKKTNIDGDQLLRKLNALETGLTRQPAFCSSTAFSESREQAFRGMICVRMHILTSTAYESIP